MTATAHGENELAAAVSPYLLQHKDNPVHWREWSDAALAEAKRRDRPILLSVGYAACHWCHVMAHESFEDPEVAAVMNDLFVNVKVDREERPDIDHLYITALQALGEQGGWPMTMILTPDGKPFFGGTYFPKEARFGRPGFVEVLRAIDRAWAERREEIATSASAIAERLGGFLTRSAEPGSLEALGVAGPAARIADMLDPAMGGLRGAPKFPSAPFMEVLARSAFETGEPAHREGFLKTVDALCRGGIYDHVGGGLHRYATDDRWLVPHFEKMLYDNAQFIRHLTWAHRATGDPLHRRRVRETIGWLDREMRLEGGGFAASLDADSPDAEGHSREGAFYVWTAAEIEAALGERAAAFATAHDVTPEGNWEGQTILHRLHEQGARSEATFDEERDSLLTARAERHRPGRDDKVLADWNGMMIRALAEAAAARMDERALDRAREAFAFVTGRMVVEGRLCHAWREGRAAGLALSTDYGALIQAAVALYAATLEPAYLATGRWLADELDRWHGDGAGGHYLNASDASDVLMRLRGDFDDAVASPTGLVIEGLAMLAQASGETALLERAETAARLAAGRIGDQAANHPGILAAIGRLRRGGELGLFGYRSNPGFEACRDTAGSHVDLDRLDLVGAHPAELAEGHALAEARPERYPAAYLCSAGVCRPPVHTAEDLAKLLAGAA